MLYKDEILIKNLSIYLWYFIIMARIKRNKKYIDYLLNRLDKFNKLIEQIVQSSKNKFAFKHAANLTDYKWCMASSAVSIWFACCILWPELKELINKWIIYINRWDKSN